MGRLRTRSRRRGRNDDHQSMPLPTAARRPYSEGQTSLAGKLPLNGIVPPEPGARSLRQNHFLQMQQQLGNVQTQRMWDKPVELGANGQITQLQELNGTADTVGNPLVGLKHRDGLDWGTWERRPRVKMLQDKLNQKMLAGLGIDGMFGDKTRQALQEFQLSIDVVPHDLVDPVTADALMGKKKSETPPQPGPPEPSSAEFNPALEDTLNAIWNAQHFILLARRDELVRLGRQLKKDKTSRFSEKIKGKLTTAAEEGLHKATDKQRDKLLTGLIGETAKSAVVKVMDAGFTPAVSFLIEGAIDLAIDLFAPEPKDAPDGTAVDVFIEGQTKTVTDAAFQAEQTFITQGKQEFRKKEAEAPGQGVAQAQELLATLKAQQQKSGNIQYDESLTRWILMMAEEDLGKHLHRITEEDMGLEMGDLSKVKTARGVLKIKVFGLSPSAPLIIDTSEPPRMAGLSDAARKKLKEKTINEMGVPVVAEGENLGRLNPDPQHPQGREVKEDVNFRINDKNTVWGWDKPMNVKIWLQQKQAGSKPPASPGDDQAAIDGLLIALRREIGVGKLSKDIKDE
jgi:peptidoglycan hydrolase-like protein with peptidoglycan-binding domain